MTKPLVEVGGPAKQTVNLQAILADLISLSLQAKQAHWNVTGALFAPLHQMLDGFADSYRDWYDDIAERLRALKVSADGRATTIAKTSKVPELRAGEIADGELIPLFLERMEGVAGRMRGVLEAIGAQDPVTQDMLIAILTGLEKQAWMLRVQQT